MTAVCFDVSAIHTRSGGVWRYAQGLLSNLPESVDARPLARHDDLVSWGEGTLRCAPSQQWRRLVWQHSAMSRVAKSHAATVLHGLHYAMPIRARSLRTVVSIHDLAWLRWRPGRERWYPMAKQGYFPVALHHSAKTSDAVICFAERVGAELREIVGKNADVHVIPHGLDKVLFTDQVRQDEAARWQHLEETFSLRGPYIAYLGAQLPRKNIATLLEAFTVVRRENPDLHLVLLGDSRDGPDSLPAGARSIGFIDDADVPVLLRGASAFVYPSLEEGFGLPVLEAMACGTPVITSCDSVMSDLADGAATVADPRSATDLARAILDVLAGNGPDPIMGIERARRHSWEESAERHAAVYRSLN